MKKLQSTIITIMAVLGLVAIPLVPAATTFAADSPVDSIEEGLKGAGGSDANQDDLKKNIQTVVNVLLFILGAIAVIVIIIGGIRYTTSNGDPGQTKAAKDTILYAVIGLIVAILAYAIVSFVLNAFKK